MDDILLLISSAFTRGGFTVETEESEVRMHRNTAVRYAFPKLKKAETSKSVSGRGQYLGSETTVTAEVKCFGTECGYSDGAVLRTMVGRTGRILLLQHEKNVKWLSTGEITRDAVTGRLFITVTLVIRGYEEAEVTAS